MNITPDDVEVLRAIATRGGRDVRFSTVRLETGYSRPKMRYRWSKLDGDYLITDHVGDPGHVERTATLTTRARDILDDLPDEDECAEGDGEPTVEDLQERVETLETRVELLTSQHS